MAQGIRYLLYFTDGANIKVGTHEVFSVAVADDPTVAEERARFIAECLNACKDFPDVSHEVSRLQMAEPYRRLYSSLFRDFEKLKAERDKLKEHVLKTKFFSSNCLGGVGCNCDGCNAYRTWLKGHTAGDENVTKPNSVG